MTKLGPEARELVDAGRGALRPSADDKARVREALRARLGAPSAVQNIGQTPTAPPAAPLVWGKVAAIMAGVVVVGAVGFRWLGGRGERLSRLPASSSATAAVVSAAPSTGPAPSAPIASPAPAYSQGLLPAAPPVEAPRRPADRLGEEVSILSRAEAELHVRHFTSALRLLDEHQRRFPHGKLAQERIAATIQALCGLGRTSEADAALARLAPDSVHEGRARAACSKGQADPKSTR